MVKKAPNTKICVTKSYRPISLLPVLGKGLERIICTGLLAETVHKMSPLQYGFIKGRSTNDAIKDLINWHQINNEKHQIVILLDITGAFDNLKWTILHKDLEELGTSISTRKIIKNYLQNMRATLNYGGIRKSITPTKGCPQGSILGPALWNATINKLLLTELPVYSRIQAYADDIAVSVTAPTRNILVTRASAIMDKILRWGRERELTLSPTKSTAVLLKSTLTPGYTIQIGNHRIVTKGCAKYLGIWLDQKLNFIRHIEETRDKNLTLFPRLRSVIGEKWGMKKKNAMLLYKAVFIPKILYGVDLWHNAADITSLKKTLLSMQRAPFITITSAYKTASSESLQVVSGTLPLEAKLQATRIQTRKLPEKDHIINRKYHELLNVWQARWKLSSKAPWTHRIFPDVRSRMQVPLWSNHCLTQFLTGHGNFRAKLHQLGLANSSNCSCVAQEETPEHILYYCPRVTQYREKLISTLLKHGKTWPCQPRDLWENKEIYSALDLFAGQALYTDV